MVMCLMVYFASFYDVSIVIWKCSDSVVFLGGNVPTLWYFLEEMFRQCGIFWGKCSDSVVFLGGNVPTVWYFLLFILLFAQNKIRFIVYIFVHFRLIII